jgi:F-box protein, helicase, 18
MAMEPTEEQKAILAAGGRVIRINARAGTGKTTTLRMLSDEHADKKILYLVFNKKAQEDAKSKFPRNVKVKTVHALAWGYVGRDYGPVGDFSPRDLLPYFRTSGNPQILARIAHDFLIFFLNSPFERIEDAVGDFEKLLPDQAKDLFKRRVSKVIEATRNLATQWNRKEKPCPHDFYLKMFHKLGTFDKALGHYDMILVDEAQDLSGVMLDALKKCKKRVVIVGDTHQQIYGFRYAIDAMRTLLSDEEYDLTLSFRFGNTVANLASLLIREAKGDQRFQILGNPGRTSNLEVTDNVPRKNCAILSRTNLALFANAMDLRSKKAGFRFERDIDKVLWQTLDVYWLVSGEKSKIRSEWLQSFENMKALDEYADNCEDFQLKGMSQVVRRYSYSFPEIIYEMAGINRNKPEELNPGDVVLSTIHASKGQEYERVYINSDVADMLGSADKMGQTQYDEEVNVAYVGFTRAIKHLFISNSFERILNPKWRDFLSSYKHESRATEKIARAAPAYVRKKKPKSAGFRSAEGSRSAASSNPPGKEKAKSTGRSPKVGDRVKTPHGQGRVVEMRGSECLVKLDNQPASVWERKSGIKFSGKGE